MGNLKQMPISRETEYLLLAIEEERLHYVQAKLRRRRHLSRVTSAVGLMLVAISMLIWDQ